MKGAKPIEGEAQSLHENQSPPSDTKLDFICGQLGINLRYLYMQVTWLMVLFSGGKYQRHIRGLEEKIGGW